MRYRIERECWSENTYNGYEDAPYWKITLAGGNVYGLADNGEWWKIKGVIRDDTEQIRNIVSECNLPITII